MSTQVKGSVLVAGGGIAGIQAALDLAESGFYVYLAERRSAIGGTMAQLDKTFPTNDCSMCIISPKLVECGRHLNIELLTNTEIESLSGEAGDFTVRLRQHPRYVDIDKCTSCGECQKVCPIEVDSEFDAGLSMRRAAYKLYPQGMPSAYAITKRGTSPCRATCPTHVSVQGFIALMAKGKYREALALFKQSHPFPGICGRVCHHPCEGACNRGKADQSLSIQYLHRFLADLDAAEDEPYVPRRKQAREEKIAVIGSGPAGLSSAYFLAMEGYAVTVFEKQAVIGGMLTLGIPEYRLPRQVVEKEVDVIRRLGVAFRTGVEIGRDFTIGQLREQGYRAFFMGVGSHECKVLGIEGENLPGVHPGVANLRDVRLGRPIRLGRRVAVIGGGNVAMDAARTALRLGAEKPFIIYRRSLEEMPASEEELEECAEEGVEIMTLTAPLRLLSENGRVRGLECIRMRLGKPDESGRRRPEPVPGSEFTIAADDVIPAIGQESDWACLTEECACTLTDWGTLRVDPLTLQSDDPDIFAGGDAVSGPGTVVEAIAAGRQAAVSIDRFINGRDLAEGRDPDFRVVTDIGDLEHRPIPRQKMPRVLAQQRTADFNEVQLGYDEVRAKLEADRCLQCGICSECYQCVRACLPGAVIHDQQPRVREIRVGAVIASPGFAPFNPRRHDTYNYARHPNVVTSVEFERILSASGPYAGHLLRPSDGKAPEKIAWIQCVGSRDTNQCDNGYCSGVCCMYAVKQTVIAMEHSPQGLETAVFFMDMRTYGKDFEKYYQRAAEKGVRFIRSRVHSIDMLSRRRLMIRYGTEDGRIAGETFDMVVLSVGMSPSHRVADLAERLGIELNEYGFARTCALSPVSTSREGISVCGAFQGPKDIPQSVVEASAAASAAGRRLSAARGTLTRTRDLPPERDFGDQEPRIGVFVCNCGINIGGVADVPAVREYARGLPHVVHVEDNLFTCAQDSQDKIKKVIMEKGINRVVVAACSPRTHEPIFQETIRETGLNRYLFEMANIRDQNTWVHMNEPEKATRKAKDLVRMAVAKAARIRPLHRVPMRVNKSLLVVGGGVAGLEAALGAADQGVAVTLVERSSELGGNARLLGRTWQGDDIQVYLADLVARVRDHPRVQVFVQTEVKKTSGVVGGFSTTLVSRDRDPATTIVEHGATVLAVGGREHKPDVYLYGQHPDVLTHLDLDAGLSGGDPRLSAARIAVFIQCVGSRVPERNYCSRLCCTHSLQSALQLKSLNPQMAVFILYRDMRSYGFREDLYREARRRGVLFIRYGLEHPPMVSAGGDRKLALQVVDHVLQRKVTLRPDLLVLATGVDPNANRELFELFKVPVNANGFLVEAHAKLRPVDFASEGIFMAGLAHYPKPVDESIAQAQAAVSRAMTILSRDEILVGGVVSTVESQRCAACLTCVRTCPYRVPRIGKEGHAVIEPAECHGCGICVSECPGKAITLQHFTDEQINAKTDALFAEA